MKTFKNLYLKICTFENLLIAARKAQRGKRFKPATAIFNIKLEKELLRIQQQLQTKTYVPGKYTEFYIFDPKKRMISAAPYFDRVVHHALCNVIEPIFENTFIYDSYANQKGKGTHKAIQRYQRFARKNKFVLKCDIRKYFPSIDHQILKQEIHRKIACKDTLWLIETIIDHSNPQEEILAYFPGDDLFTPIERRRGLPIGNLTSQFFANVYLNRFDHFVKETLKCKYYIRYVDDFVIFSNNKIHLWFLKKACIKFLNNFRVQLHENKSRIFRVNEGVCFLGNRIFPEFRLLKKENVRRFRRKLKKFQQLYQQEEITLAKIKASIQGWLAHAFNANTFRLRKKIFSEFKLQKTRGNVLITRE